MQFPSFDGVAHLIHISVPLIDGDDPAGRSRNMVQKFLCDVNRNAERSKISRACAPEVVQRPVIYRTSPVEVEACVAARAAIKK